MEDQDLAGLLIRSGLVAMDTIQSAAQRRRPGKNLAQVLVEMGAISREAIERVAPECLNPLTPAKSAPSPPSPLPQGERGAPPTAGPLDLGRYPIQETVLTLLPRDRAIALQAIPLEIRNNRLMVAMANPTNLPQIDELSRLTGMRIDAFPATQAMIMQAINTLYPSSEQLEHAMEMSRDAGRQKREEERSPELLDAAPSVRIIDAILGQGVELGASDIHLEPRADHFYLRYRIDGLLRPPQLLDKSMQAALTSRLKVLAGMDIAESRMPQDGRFRQIVRNRTVDFRVSTLPTYHGEKVVMRVLDKAAVLVGLQQLGMLPDTRQTFEELCLRPQGMILVTGPTGSGKSTTLYAALNRAKSETKNVVTVEDPIEYQVEGINQTTINARIDLTFARQLRAILRQDPDVILVGEIRDRETADMAFRAALTGHLVMSTLHTNDAPSAMTRLVDMGIEPYLIASSVMAVLAQRLVRTSCEKCRQPYEPSDLELARIGMLQKEAQGIQFMRGTGCQACGYTGFKGRNGIYELMLISEPIRVTLMRGGTASELRRAAITRGMRTLREDGIERIKQGVTTPEEVARVIFAFTDDEEGTVSSQQ